jgi:ubiquinone/menaquinone biosynthesis C-methylase UbiE
VTESAARYVHGTHPREQARLALMNRLINDPSLETLALRGGERVLDVGCGLAEMSRRMARAVGPDGRVVAVERDPDQLAGARRLAAEAGEPDLVDLRAGDALALPLAAEEWATFDVIYSRFVLEHLTEPLEAVSQMVAAARPGGRLALQDDDHDLLRLWPPCPEFELVWRAYYESYSAQGTDAYVGRKLPALLHEAGASPTRCELLFYGACNGASDFAGIVENAVEVIHGARATIVAAGAVDDDAVTRAIDAMRSWTTLPGAAFWYAMSYAEGVKAHPAPSEGWRGIRTPSS